MTCAIDDCGRAVFARQWCQQGTISAIVRGVTWGWLKGAA